MKHRGIRIPEPLMLEVEQLLQIGYKGYRSKAEFVCVALREKIEREQEVIKKWKEKTNQKVVSG